MDGGFSPFDLQKGQRFVGQVTAGSPQISGKIHDDHTGNIIHSKIIVTDK